jgi:hypothetical protein
MGAMHPYFYLIKTQSKGDYMSIITKPAIQKGQENVITLAKSELATQSKIVSDSYFSNQSNWKQVVLTYESAVGNQMKRVVFDASEATPEGVLELSDKAKNEFEVKTLTIFDFDGGYLKLYRGDLNTSQFDIVIGSVVSEASIVWDVLTAGATAEPDGGIYGGSTSSGSFSKSSTVFSGDLHLTAYIDTSVNLSQTYFFGFSDNATVDSLGTFTGVEINSSNYGQYNTFLSSVQGVFSSPFTPSANTKVEVIRQGTTVTLKINDVVVDSGSVTVFNAYPIVRNWGSAQGIFKEANSGSVVSGNFVTWDIANAQGIDTYELLGDGSVKKTSGSGYIGVIPTVEFIPANSDGYIEMTYVDINESESIVWGLSSTITSSYGSINFNLYKAISPLIEGTLGNTSISVNNGDVFRIAREGSLIKAYKNYVDESSVPFQTVSDSTNGALLYGAASLYYTDSAIRLVKIG